MKKVHQQLPQEIKQLKTHIKLNCNRETSIHQRSCRYNRNHTHKEKYLVEWYSWNERTKIKTISEIMGSKKQEYKRKYIELVTKFKYRIIEAKTKFQN